MVFQKSNGGRSRPTYASGFPNPQPPRLRTRSLRGITGSSRIRIAATRKSADLGAAAQSMVAGGESRLAACGARCKVLLVESPDSHESRSIVHKIVAESRPTPDARLRPSSELKLDFWQFYRASFDRARDVLTFVDSLSVLVWTDTTETHLITGGT